MNAGRDVERLIASWLAEEAPRRAPDRILDVAGQVIDRTGQRRFVAPQSFNPLARISMAAVVVVVVVGAAVLALRPTLNVGGWPSPSPTIAPTHSLPPAIPTRPPNLFTLAPVVPATPMPDPPGAPLPSELIGRTYLPDPPETQGTQALILTLRAADDPHCVAMYGGRSTCFTILWEPNYPKHITDPGVRGPARIVDGRLVLGFALVKFDPGCEGTSSTYAIAPGGATLTATDVPACSFQGFRQE